MREKTIAEVMREPAASYDVAGFLGDKEEEHSYDDEQEALDAAAMLESGGAANVIVNRRTLRVIEDVERIYPGGDRTSWQVEYPVTD